jgi:uncharacterized protein (DUF58 family)
VKRSWRLAGELLLAAIPALVLVWSAAREQPLTPIPRFFLQVGIVAAPLAVLAWFHRIYPAPRLIALMAIPAALSLALLVDSRLLTGVWIVDGAVALLALVDLVTLPRSGTLSLERSAGRIASLRKPHRVTLSVRNHSQRRFAATIRDGLAGDLTGTPPELKHVFTPHSRTEFDYELFARRRGAFALSQVFTRVESRWRLWNRIFVSRVETTIHVYPDLKQLSQYAVLARLNRLNLLGVRRTRRFGQDNDFERLRDYSPSDNYKHIDWRSTARRGKLTVKDFQQNQSQRLYLLIDCGRMMTNQSRGISLLDHAFNAALLLSYVALSHGDAVGMLCFSDAIHSFVPARSGMQQMNRLLHASFNQFPHLTESRYDRAFLYLDGQSRKRSLVVLITNLIDDVNRNQIEQYLENLVGRHLPLGVLLRDRRVYEYFEGDRREPTKFYSAAAAADVLTWRQQVLCDLHAKGVLSLDVFPDELTAPLVNRYLEIKARHLL